MATNLGNNAQPCIDPPGLHIQDEQIFGDGNTYAQGAIFQFQENANVRNRILPNPVLIRMPLTTDVSLCGQPSINPFGIIYRYGGTTGNTSVNCSPGGALNGGGNGFTNISIDLPFPVDMALSLSSFSTQFGFGERFFFGTACDEFIAGSGSNLATSPTGYPANTIYFDGNAGGSIAIYRNVTQVRFTIDGHAGLICGFTPRFLKTHNIIRRDVNDGTANWPPAQAVQDAIGSWPWRGGNGQITIPV